MHGKVVNRTPTVAKLSTYIVQTTRQSVRARRRCAQDVRHVYQQAACMQCTRCSLECIVVVISATEVCTGQCRYSVHLSFCCIHPIRSLSNHAAFHPSIHPAIHPAIHPIALQHAAARFSSLHPHSSCFVVPCFTSLIACQSLVRCTMCVCMVCSYVSLHFPVFFAFLYKLCVFSYMHVFSPFLF